MQTVINIYKVPNWINHIAVVDNICYIATENVYPVYISGTGRVGGERRRDFEMYYSDDFKNWVKLDMEFDTVNLGYRPALYDLNGTLFAVDYTNVNLNQYTKQCRQTWILSKNVSPISVEYESSEFTGIGRCGNYLYTQSYADNENPSNIAFSADGIYWYDFPLTNHVYVEAVYENPTDIIIKGKLDNEYIYYSVGKSQLNAAVFQSYEDSVYVRIDNKILGFDTPPVIEDGRTLVPMRFLFERIGANVDWDAATRTALASLNGTEISFAVDNICARVNKASVTMDVPARLIDGKTMVPLRFLSETLGYDVTWDAETRTAIINR